MSDYVLYQLDRGAELYWTGGFTAAGKPTKTKHVGKATRFASAKEVYAVATPLKLFEWWQPGKRGA